ncbi:MAG: tRNA uridine-5-carboxymethylaminomethyl(34) synthesis GTPase MnmE [Thermodesulfobacteriota bacterium]
MENTTIAAIATPVAAGGVGVIRVSGPRAMDILVHVFRQIPATGQNGKKTAAVPVIAENLTSHRFYHGFITDGDQPLDEVLVVFMRGPRSYTGEDVVEIHAHSGPLVLRTILQLLLNSGARLAEPGEFTRRAVINGRMDLTQAEAVADIIEARSIQSLSSAVYQATGMMRREIEALLNELTGILAELEAAIDFSDQVPVPVCLADVQRRLKTTVAGPIRRLISRHDEYVWLKTGVTVALAGIPNVGKSTLLNSLLDRPRAIVSAIPGTTRDFIEETVLLEGIPFVFTDTAGLRRSATDEVEKIGIQRTRDILSQADTVVFMVDADTGVLPEELTLLETLKPCNVILVANKGDLPGARTFSFPPEWKEAFPGVIISALTGEGLPVLKEMLVARYRKRLDRQEGDVLIPNLRQKIALEESLEAVSSALGAIDSHYPEDLVAIDLRRAVDALYKVTGRNTGWDVLDDIFNRFCVGK